MSLYDGLGISDSRDDGKDKKPDVCRCLNSFDSLSLISRWLKKKTTLV